ncbi:MAG: hypothetical protein JXA41_06525 [Deltaproteobacteria bacterium]|nr:hypothetical protein [Deltaproteobacteria bacterium]
MRINLMSMLMFMPWCPIDNEYTVGDINILPYEREGIIKDVDDFGQSCLKTIMAAYKDIEGNPVHKTAIISKINKSVIDDLPDDDIEIAQELTAIACFSGLANRSFFNSLGSYCNSDCFSMYIQKFDKADFIALKSRRREGRTLSGWSLDDIAIPVPVHCHTIQRVSLDKDLLFAIIEHRTSLDRNEWGRWQNAISCFNQANSDSDNIRYQMEWVLLCSAFEHILESKPTAKNTAEKFIKVFTPSTELLVKNSMRLSHNQDNANQPIRYQWMKEFYRIRGDYAHGRLNTKQHIAWEPLEHLVLASIAFPLVIKTLLSRVGKYDITDTDQAQIDCFEHFADTKNFLNSPKKQRGSLDSHWSRLLSKRRYNISIEQGINRLRNLRESAQSEQINSCNLKEDE